MPEAAAHVNTQTGAQIGETGTLLTYTIIRKPPAAFADDGIYAVCVVDMADGRRVTGRLDRYEPEPEMGATVEVIAVQGPTPIFANDDR